MPYLKYDMCLKTAKIIANSTKISFQTSVGLVDGIDDIISENESLIYSVSPNLVQHLVIIRSCCKVLAMISACATDDSARLSSNSFRRDSSVASYKLAS